METFRNLLRHDWRIAVLLLAVMLSMKTLVPPGHMLVPQGKVLTIQICADTQGARLTKQIVVPQSGDRGDQQNKYGKTDGLCPYAGLTFAAVSGANPVLLGLALAFILLLGLVPARVAPHRRSHHLRPPLRGPPALG